MVSVRQTSEATHKEVSQFKYSQQWFRATKFIEHGLQKPVGYAVGSTSSLSNPAINHPVALSEDQVSDKEQRDPIDSPSHDNYRLHPTCRIRGPGQSTPSDTATGIVESMRSCSGTRDIRSELGCQSNYNCMVRNMDIFQLLNEG